MSEVAIRCEGLGKRYRIGKPERYRTLRDTLTDAVYAPFRRIRSAFQPSSFPAAQHPNGDDTIWALKDVSFEITQGEVVGIIGRNGAGKSTLLKILSRITEPTEGHAEIQGRVGSLLEVGTGFHPELTGRENIYLNGAILGMKRAEMQRKFDEIVAFAEVNKFIDTPVKHYSSGMYLRLAFAVAAHLEPEILLVDEVLAVGDAAFQKKCLGKMGDVAKEGRTVLFVSHNMNAIEQLCTACLLLDKGRQMQLSQDVRVVIKEYLFGQGDELESSEWVNHGREFDNPWFKPLRFFISDEHGKKQSMPLSNNSEMWVQIKAEIQAIDPALTVGYAVYAEDGSLLYWSYQTDQSEDRWPRLKEGVCVLRSRIPPRFLNEGVYRVELIGGLHFREWLFEPGISAPSIYVNIQGGLSDSPYWMIKRAGLLAPVMEWTAVE